MDVKILGLETLATMDRGLIAEAFARELKRAADDCEDRPFLKKARTLNIQFTVTPDLTGAGHCDGVSINVDVNAARLPKMTANTVHAKRGQGGLYVNDFNPDDLPGQTRAFGPEGVDTVTGEIKGDGTNG